MTSYFQDGGHDSSPPLAAASSVSCPLADRAHATSWTRYMRYSSWSSSIVHSHYFNHQSINQ